MIHLLSLEFLEFILLCFIVLASAALSELSRLLPLFKYPTISTYKLELEQQRDLTIDEAPDSRLWQKVWALRVPNKIRLFIWKACRGILHVVDKLRESGVFIDGGSSGCEIETESIIHALGLC